MFLTQKKENKTEIKTMQESYRSKVERCEKRLLKDNKEEEKEEIGKLKKKQKEEMKNLKEELGSKGTESRKKQAVHQT